MMMMMKRPRNRDGRHTRRQTYTGTSEGKPGDKDKLTGHGGWAGRFEGIASILSKQNTKKANEEIRNTYGYIEYKTTSEISQLLQQAIQMKSVINSNITFELQANTENK